MLKLLQLRFLPTSANLALLVLRIRFAVPLLTMHGWSKVTSFAERSQRFADPFGNGELPFMFLGAFVMLLIAGGGRFSIDARTGAR